MLYLASAIINIELAEYLTVNRDFRRDLLSLYQINNFMLKGFKGLLIVCAYSLLEWYMLCTVFTVLLMVVSSVFKLKLKYNWKVQIESYFRITIFLVSV